MLKRLIASAVLMGLLSTQVLISSFAYAGEPSDTVTPTVSDEGTLTTRQTYLTTETTPDFPETLTFEGQEYSLQQTETVVDADYTHPTQYFSRAAFSEVPLTDINNLSAYFPATMAIEEGDFKGEIALDPANPFSVVSRYEILRAQVDRTLVVSGLPDNDVTRLPTEQAFEVRSSESPDSTCQQILRILDVSYEIAGTDHLGLPNNYTATVTYRGQEEYLELHHYDVTANYAGDIPSAVEQMAATGIYTLVPVPTPAPGNEVVITEEAPPLAEPEFSLFPLALSGTTVVVFLALPVFYIFFLNNARLIRVIDDGKKVSTRLICRRRLALKNGEAEFLIPSDADIMDGSQYYLVIKPHFANREGDVVLVWQERIVSVLPLDRHTTINFREMLITSVESVLMETDILH